VTELLVERRPTHEVWRLNRPERRNALSLSLLGALDRAREAAEADGITVVVLTGNPPEGTFSAGFDLDDLRKLAGGASPLHPPASPLHEAYARLEAARFSLVTAINGAAIGGACELALLGDVRVASPTATLLLPPSRLGLVYPAEGLTRLSRALGPSLLSSMLATALPVTAERLHLAGALHDVVEDPLAEAERLATLLSAYPLAARLGNRDAVRACSLGSGRARPPAGPFVTPENHAKLRLVRRGRAQTP
jgi:enoyl-CoA hydratase/carnithine racemase